MGRGLIEIGGGAMKKFNLSEVAAAPDADGEVEPDIETGLDADALVAIGGGEAGHFAAGGELFPKPVENRFHTSLVNQFFSRQARKAMRAR